MLAALARAQGQKPDAAPAESVRFEAVHVYVDSKDQPLAAYQFELVDKSRTIKIVGIEGGEHAAFKQPPYYDPAALMNKRVIIAAFNTGRDLPRGKTRVATIHVQLTGDRKPEYEVKLQVAASSDGRHIPATVSLGQGEAK